MQLTVAEHVQVAYTCATRLFVVCPCCASLFVNSLHDLMYPAVMVCFTLLCSVLCTLLSCYVPPQPILTVGKGDKLTDHFCMLLDLSGEYTPVGPLRMLGSPDDGKRAPPGQAAKEITLVLTDVQVSNTLQL